MAARRLIRCDVLLDGDLECLSLLLDALFHLAPQFVIHSEVLELQL